MEYKKESHEREKNEDWEGLAWGKVKGREYVKTDFDILLLILKIIENVTSFVFQVISLLADGNTFTHPARHGGVFKVVVEKLLQTDAPIEHCGLSV